MSTTIEEPTIVSVRNTTPPRILHLYPPNPYGGRPDVGTKAICGHVKRTPTQFASTNQALGANRQRCIVCFDLIPNDARL